MPISLSPGYIHTHEFEINVESTYTIAIEVNWTSDFARVRCAIGIDQCTDKPAVLGAAWSLSNRGRIVASGSSEREYRAIFLAGTVGRELGSFHAGKGYYILDLNVSRDGSQLNDLVPRIVVFEAGDARQTIYGEESRALLVFLFGAPVGVFVLIRTAICRRIERLDALARTASLTQPGPQLPLDPSIGQSQPTPSPAAVRVHSGTAIEQRYRRPSRSNRPAFARPSWYGLIAVLCYLMIAIPTTVLGLEHYRTPIGLKIHLLRAGIQAPRSAGIPPVLVRVISNGLNAAPSLYMNSQLVSWEEFDVSLQKELNLRPPGWPVYFEGDPDMEWMYAVKAIDTIRGLRAEVVMLTDRPRSQ
jgi:hypothetical protein